MSKYPTARSSPANHELRDVVRDEVDRCMDALEFGLDVGTVRRRIFDALTVYACEVATRQAESEKRRASA